MHRRVGRLTIRIPELVMNAPSGEYELRNSFDARFGFLGSLNPEQNSVLIPIVERSEEGVACALPSYLVLLDESYAASHRPSSFTTGVIVSASIAYLHRCFWSNSKLMQTTFSCH